MVVLTRFGLVYIYASRLISNFEPYNSLTHAHGSSNRLKAKQHTRKKCGADKQDETSAYGTPCLFTGVRAQR